MLKKEHWVTCPNCKAEYIYSIKDFPFVNQWCPYCGYPYSSYYGLVNGTNNSGVYVFNSTGDVMNWDLTMMK